LAHVTKGGDEKGVVEFGGDIGGLDDEQMLK
jgi:hypothetical protein